MPPRLIDAGHYRSFVQSPHYLANPGILHVLCATRSGIVRMSLGECRFLFDFNPVLVLDV